ncbi:MAG: SUMF1/EgtB/PvdO family nonheme iron enzyme [Anaerolineae bacterium]|nr:SUMF1/EgtB/PvdO family nonheme iron enzyme [Anaerolineae bacterium]
MSELGKFGESITPVVETLRAALTGGRGAGVLIVLDGLDEVSEAGDRRGRLKQVIGSLAECHSNAHILVTSRTYAYRNDARWRLPAQDFPVFELAPYSDERIAFYVEHYYRAVARRYMSLSDEPQARAADLLAEIDRKKHLQDLAVRPLLLTMITLIHDHQRGKLPEGGRAALYDKATELLVYQWNHGAPRDKSLEETFGLQSRELTEALERLAYDAHRDQVDIAAEKIFGVLHRVNRKLQFSAEAVRQHLYHRMGILIADSEDVYRFPHRSFQEYLAGCALVNEDCNRKLTPPASVHVENEWDFPANLDSLMRSEPERWREAALLAAGKALSFARSRVWALVRKLCPANIPDDPEDPQYWSAWLAGQILVEYRDGLRLEDEENLEQLERPRRWLRCIVERGAMQPPERAEAGRALALLGDDRPGVCDLDIQWVTVPAGAFWMGSADDDKQANDDEKPRHKVDVKAFCIAKYPITWAQFEPFVEAGGYNNSDYWTPAGWDWRQERSIDKPSYWDDEDWRIANHPANGISWYEAMAYCKWLSEQLGYEARLPTEAEWEKAARWDPETGKARIYPWGDEYISGYANIDETEQGVGPYYLNRTTAVGMYPQGRAPCGALDMSGNVWEWCLSGCRNYLYNSEDERNNTNSTETRVLRGGSFFYFLRPARAASRDGFVPRFQGWNFGFRVASPFLYY